MPFTEQEWEQECDEATNCHSPRCQVMQALSDKIFSRQLPMDIIMDIILGLILPEPEGDPVLISAYQNAVGQFNLTGEQLRDLRENLFRKIVDQYAKRSAMVMQAAQEAQHTHPELREDAARIIRNLAEEIGRQGQKMGMGIKFSKITIITGITSLEDIAAALDSQGMPEDIIKDTIESIPEQLKSKLFKPVETEKNIPPRPRPEHRSTARTVQARKRT